MEYRYRIWVRSLLLTVMSITLLAACGGGGGGGGGGSTTGGSVTNGSGGGTVSSTCTPATVSNLQIVSTNPVSGATNVSVKTAIAVTFNTCVNMSTVNATSVIVIDSSGTVPGSFSFDGSTYTLNFTPSRTLAYGSSVVFSISTTVTGSNGETFAGGGFGFFTRATPDITPPVTTASPSGGYYNTTQNVGLTCSDGATGTGCLKTYYTTNGSTPTTSSPVYSSPIPISTSTTLKFFSVDVDGNAETVQTLNYVIDTVPPTVISTTPLNNEIGVPVTSTISAVFDEPMLASSLTNSTFYVDKGVTGTISYNNTTYTATFTPNERLTCNTLYTVTLTTGATDLAGNGLTGNYTWSFTSHSDCVEPVTTASATSGVYPAALSMTLSCSDAASGCASIVYTTDGTTPSLSPVNGTVVTGSITSAITIPVGDTTLRYFAEDGAGNREVERQQQYSVSTSGFTYVLTQSGLARGVGQSPSSFVATRAPGQTNKFFLDTTNNRLYRATANGAFVSDDSGATWHKLALSASGGFYLPVNNIYAVGSKVYAATHDGLYVSLDGGSSFNKRYPASGSAFYNWDYKVVVVGYNVYVATSDGLLVSSDKGYSFTPKTIADGLGSNYVYDVQVVGSTVYAATGGGLSISTDGGQTFNANRTTTDGLGSNTVNAVAVVGSTVYAGTAGGLSVSNDGGTTFSTNFTTASGLFANAVHDIYVSGLNVYAATGVGVSLSTDGGTTFVPATQPVSWSVGGVTVNCVYPLGTHILIGAYPSYYDSADNGATWTPIGLPSDAGVKMAVDSNGTIYDFFNDGTEFTGIAVSTDHGQTFSTRLFGDVLAGDTWGNDIFVDGTTLYVGASGLYVSTDHGQTFTTYNSTTNGISEASVDLVYAAGSTIYVVTPSGFLDKSTNGGTNFKQINTSLQTFNLAVSGANVYIAGSSGLDVSNDTWGTFALKTTANGLEANYLKDVAVDSTGQVYATALNYGVDISTDNGATFSHLSSLSATSAEWVSTCGGPVYVGSYSGLYTSTDFGTSFTNRTTADGLPSNVVVDACHAL